MSKQVPDETSKAQTLLAAEKIDYTRLGLRPVTRRVLLPPGEANTKKVGVALSENLLNRVDALAKRRFPNRPYPRSAYIREVLRAGLEAKEGADWENSADALLHETDQA